MSSAAPRDRDELAAEAAKKFEQQARGEQACRDQGYVFSAVENALLEFHPRVNARTVTVQNAEALKAIAAPALEMCRRCTVVDLCRAWVTAEHEATTVAAGGVYMSGTDMLDVIRRRRKHDLGRQRRKAESA